MFVFGGDRQRGEERALVGELYDCLALAAVGRQALHCEDLGLVRGPVVAAAICLCYVLDFVVCWGLGDRQ